VVRYTLIEWPKIGEEPDKVVFEVNLNIAKIDLLTDRISGAITGLLIKAKMVDPLGYYLPIRLFRSGSGAEILVLRDGFSMLKPDFKEFVQAILDEFRKPSTQKVSLVTSQSLTARSPKWQ
jgi:hypothetical protein